MRGLLPAPGTHRRLVLGQKGAEICGALRPRSVEVWDSDNQRAQPLDRQRQALFAGHFSSPALRSFSDVAASSPSGESARSRQSSARPWRAHFFAIGRPCPGPRICGR
jgi:hypothetical protein